MLHGLVPWRFHTSRHLSLDRNPLLTHPVSTTCTGSARWRYSTVQTGATSPRQLLAPNVLSSCQAPKAKPSDCEARHVLHTIFPESERERAEPEGLCRAPGYSCTSALPHTPPRAHAQRAHKPSSGFPGGSHPEHPDDRACTQSTHMLQNEFFQIIHCNWLLHCQPCRRKIPQLDWMWARKLDNQQQCGHSPES